MFVINNAPRVTDGGTGFNTGKATGHRAGLGVLVCR